MNNIYSTNPQPLHSSYTQGLSAVSGNLDLRLPREFGLHPPGAAALDVNPPRDSIVLHSASASAQAAYHFLDFPPPPPAPRPMSKAEFIARTREAATDLLGEGGVKALEVIGGAAHIARDGKVSYKKNIDTTLFESAQIKFEASAKNGGRVGVEFKATF